MHPSSVGWAYSIAGKKLSIGLRVCIGYVCGLINLGAYFIEFTELQVSTRMDLVILHGGFQTRTPDNPSKFPSTFPVKNYPLQENSPKQTPQGHTLTASPSPKNGSDISPWKILQLSVTAHGLLISFLRLFIITILFTFQSNFMHVYDCHCAVLYIVWTKIWIKINASWDFTEISVRTCTLSSRPTVWVKKVPSTLKLFCDIFTHGEWICNWK